MKENHGLEVEVIAGAELLPDKEGVVVLLFQAARELLLNVLKHADAKTAQLTLTCDQNRVRVVVSDQGRGFNPEDCTTGRSGAGFGLFSIRERVQLVGGQMSIESAPGHGTRIVIEVPRPESSPAPNQAMPPAPRPVPPAPPRKSPKRDQHIRVLLVDDHKMLREGLGNVLRTEADLILAGEAANGQEAIEQVRRLDPDVVIMDINMPVMNGIEATRIITGEMPSVRVIGLSMAEETDRGAAMREAGAVDFVTKSAPSAKLLAAIRRAAHLP